MKKKTTTRRKVENKQIRKMRKEIEAIMADPEFGKMSRAFKHTLAQRLGVKEFKEGGLILQAQAPVALRDILKDAGVKISDLGRIEDVLDDPYSYGNIYSYSFW